MEQIRYYEPQKTVEDIDVLVVGGGFAGVSAAIRAGRLGKKVMIIEHTGCFGGIGTSGMVNCYSRFLQKGTNALANGGLFLEYLEASRKHLGKEICTDYFDGEWMKYYFDSELRKANVRVLLHTTVYDVKKEDNRIISVLAATMSGTVEIQAKSYVDATGDGTLAVLSGCGFSMGDEDGNVQAGTLIARFANTRWDEMLPRPEMKAKWKELTPAMNLKNTAKNLLLYTIPPKNTTSFNTTCLPVKDPTDPFALSQAMMDGREQIQELEDFCRNNLPGMEEAGTVASGTLLGVRETRRIHCRYQLTAEDLMESRKFKDEIARGCYSMDIHMPDGSIKMMRIPAGTYYTIPYRSLVTAEVDNLLIAGRCIGATHEAIGAVRIMPIATCTGEAAGAAAALASETDGNAAAVDVKRLQETLISGGALICEVPGPVMEVEIC